MHTYGVILRGYKEFDYYQADRWLVENGTVSLIKDGAPVALFPFDNLLAVVNLTSGARLTEAQSRDTLASILSRTRSHLTESRQSGAAFSQFKKATAAAADFLTVLREICTNYAARFAPPMCRGLRAGR
jgi:hypothetical protein